MVDMKALLLLCLVALVVAQQEKDPDGSYSSTTLVGNPQCCGAKIMDSDRRVAIEIGQGFTAGTYKSVEVKVCEINPVYIQLWTPEGAGGLTGTGQYRLKWQVLFSPNISHITQQSVILTLESEVTVSDEDRLGLYCPESDGAKFSIPYDFSSKDYYLYLTKVRQGSSHKFSLEDSVETDDVRWPRSFRAYVSFCNEPNCPRRPGEKQVFLQGPPGAPGPPGPPGPNGLNGISFDQISDLPLSCSPTDELDQQIDAQTRKMDDLDEKMNDLTTMISKLTETTGVTGICAQGFTPGSYGVGSCYIIYKDPVPFAIAIMRCREDHGAHLVSIESELEDRFLKNEISKLATATGAKNESYWTAGMFNVPRKTWVWFDERTRQKEGMGYTNWETIVPPFPPNPKVDVCSTVTIAPLASTSAWQMHACVESQYYICEIPKKCL